MSVNSNSIYINPSGGGGNMEIGNPVIGASDNVILFVDDVGNLAQNTGLIVESGTGNILTPSALIAGNDLGSLIGIQPDAGACFIYTQSTSNFFQKLVFNDSILSDSTITLPTASGIVALTSDISGLLKTDGSNAMTANLDAGTNKIINLVTPDSDTDAVNKAYVDTFVTGLSPKTAVRVATNAVLFPAAIYNNGAFGVGATLTTLTTGTLTIDGVVTTVNDRVLIKDQASPEQNGIYTVTQAGALGVLYILTRSLDANQPSELVSAYTYTGTEGSTNANKGYVQGTPATITIGTDPIIWNLFNSNTYSPGTGIRIASNLIYSTLSEGVTGGQDAVGGTGANDIFTLKGSSSTSNRTTTDPAFIIKSMGPLVGNSGAQVFASVPISISSTGTAGYTALKVAVSDTSSGSGIKNLIELLSGTSGTTSRFSVDSTGSVTITKHLNISDNGNIVIGTSTGTKIGTSTSQKIGFYNSTPIVKPTGNIITALSNLGLVSSGTVSVSDISATGTPSSTTYLRGDGTWSTITDTDGWTVYTLTGSDFVLAAGSITAVPGLVTGILDINSVYDIELYLNCNSSTAAGLRVSLDMALVTPTKIDVLYIYPTTIAVASISSSNTNNGLSGNAFTGAGLNGIIRCTGSVVTSGLANPKIQVNMQKNTSGNATMYANGYTCIKIKKRS